MPVQRGGLAGELIVQSDARGISLPKPEDRTRDRAVNGKTGHDLTGWSDPRFLNREIVFNKTCGCRPGKENGRDEMADEGHGRGANGQKKQVKSDMECMAW